MMEIRKFIAPRSACLAAVVALALIEAWRSVMRKKLACGGTYAWSLWTRKWTVPVPPAEVVPPDAEQPSVAAAPEWRSA